LYPGFGAITYRSGRPWPYRAGRRLQTRCLKLFYKFGLERHRAETLDAAINVMNYPKGGICGFGAAG